jgi:hypothetical protein
VVGVLVSATTDDASLACNGTGLVLGDWGWGSGEITCALSASRFRGPRLSTLVSAWLREDECQHRQNKSEESSQAKAEVIDLHLGAHMGHLHRAIRHALLGGGALRALLEYGAT